MVIEKSSPGQSFTLPMGNSPYRYDHIVAVPNSFGKVSHLADNTSNPNSFVIATPGKKGSLTITLSSINTFPDTLKIYGYPEIEFKNSGSKDVKMTILRWGDVAFASLDSAFLGCSNLNVQAMDTPNFITVSDVSYMFKDCDSLDANFGHWNVAALTNMQGMLDATGMSVKNYDSTLIGWAGQSVNPNILLGASNVDYCIGYTARQTLLANNWTLNDGVQNCGNPFITTWLVTDTLIIPTTGTGYLYDVDWDNDGTFDEFGITGSALHVYTGGGSQTIQIQGAFPQILMLDASFQNSRLQEVIQWGHIEWRSMENAFADFSNIIFYDLDAPDLSKATSLAGMFRNGNGYVGYSLFGATSGPVLDKWNVSTITNMSGMFANMNTRIFGINAWNTSAVEDMSNMFAGVSPLFNQNLGGWNVSAVVNMDSMFFGATGFNADLSSWNTSTVTSVVGMFAGATSFNNDLGAWDLSAVTDMSNMLDATALTPKNYNRTLLGWYGQRAGLNTNVNVGVAGLEYCSSANARDTLILKKQWTFNGDAKNCYPFKMILQTTAANETITIPTTGSGYNYDVDWGDGTATGTALTGDETHTYSTPGNYVVSIGGEFPRIDFSTNPTDAPKILSITQWGLNFWKSMENAFSGCINLTVPASLVSPSLDSVGSMKAMFKNCAFLNTNFNDWKVSSVTDMSELFSGCTAFNQNLTSWNTSAVIDMSGMFLGCTAFNQNIGGWNVAAVTNMSSMFLGCSTFNIGLNVWNVGAVTNMSSMFSGCTAFNKNIVTWNTSAVIDMSSMFSGCSAFNYNANGWSLRFWNVSAVTNMSNMFSGCTAFNQDIGTWTTSAVTNMSNMFSGCTAFNQNIGTWPTIAVTNMSGMFSSCTVFNQNIGIWNTAAVTNMSSMLSSANAFNQYIGALNVASVTNMSNMLDNTALSKFNYETTLRDWGSQLGLKTGVTLGANGLTYCLAQGRNTLVQAPNNWTIIGDQAICGNPYVTTWDLRKGTNNHDRISILASASYLYYYDVDWNNDGTYDDFALTGDITHIYANPTTTDTVVTIAIRGNYPYHRFDNLVGFAYNTDYSLRSKLIRIDSWGDQSWAAFYNKPYGTDLTEAGMYYSCINLKVAAIDTIDISQVASFSYAFYNCTSLDSIPGINNWVFNGTMSNMFFGCTIFNQNLGGCSVSNIPANSPNLFRDIFTGTALSTQNYDAIFNGWYPQFHWSNQIWNGTGLTFCAGEVERLLLTNKGWTFTDTKDPLCGAFLTTWATTSPSETITLPIYGSDITVIWGDGNSTTSITNPTGAANPSHVYATAGTYQVSISGTYTQLKMNFSADVAKLKSIDAWGENAWTSMNSAFAGCTNLLLIALDDPDLSGVADMSSMFNGCALLNANISGWITGAATNMNSMFKNASAFNQAISSWDVSAVTTMNSMFEGASAFSQNLSAWDVSSATSMSNMFTGAPQTTANYDALLINWLPKLQIFGTGVHAIGAGVSEYCASLSAKNAIIANGWTISDGGSDAGCNTWIGAVDSSWQQTANWAYALVPNSSIEVFILNSPNQPIIDAVADAKSVHIESGASLKIRPGFCFTVADAFVNNGTFLLNATANSYAQYKGPSVSATYKQVIGEAGWHSISSPFSNTTLADLQFDNSASLVLTPSTACNIKFYDPTTYQAAPTSSWTNAWGSWVDAATLNEPFDGTIGWNFYLDGNYASSFPVTITLSGLLNEGNVTTVLDEANGGWSLLSNPFSSVLDWESAFDNSALANTYHVWDASNSNYATYQVGGAATFGATQFIAPMQSVFVRTSTWGDGTFGATTSVLQNHTLNADADAISSCSATPINAFYKTEDVKVKLKTTTSANSFSDELVLLFNNSYQSSYNALEDATKFFSPEKLVPSIFAIVNNKSCVIAGYPTPDKGNVQRIPLGYKANSGAEITIAAVDLPGSITAFLEDKENNTFHNLIAPYNFTAKEPASSARFVLHVGDEFLRANSLSNNGDDYLVYQKDDYLIFINNLELVDGKAQLQSMAGQIVAKSSVELDGQMYVGRLTIGLYLLTIEKGGHLYIQKVVIK